MLRPLLALAVSIPFPLMAAAEPIRYVLRFPAPETHYVEVEASVPTAGRERIEMLMAVWTPGSYLVRDYSGRVESVSAAAGGRELAVEKTAKNRWTVAAGGAEQISFRYRVYSREMSVRTNWVEKDFAVLVGAATFATLADEHGEPAKIPHEFRLELPAHWPDAHAALPAAPDGAGHSYVAADFDELIDSPILAGDLAVYGFAVDGVPHALVNLGEGGVWDGPRSAADVEKIVREQTKFWGVIPYERYSVLNAITEAGGGLEHKSSTLLMTSRWRTRTREGYLRWLFLVSHELFHAWNVKRLRPVELGPFDYEREVHTESLWVAEGVTSYYDPLLVRRAGLATREEYLEELSKEIAALETRPGRYEQSAAEASFDAWVKAYRPNENSPNSTVSYYNKGALIAFLLDAEIRRLTNGAKSLDHAMRLAYERFSGDKGFTQAEFRRTVSDIAGEDLSEWLAARLDRAGGLDYSVALEWYGLRFKPPEEKGDGEPGAWLGFETRLEEGLLKVNKVRRGTPAHAAGVNVDDEVLAIDDFRVPPQGLDERLKAYRPGDRVSLLVSRREKLIRLEVTVGEKPNEDAWKLEVDSDASAKQQARLAAWLGE